MDTLPSSPGADSICDASRRHFLKAGTATAGVILAESVSTRAAALMPLEMTNVGPQEIPRKPLGKTGEHVSIIGLGGFHLGTMVTQKEVNQLVHEALDAGVTFIDNAWEYNQGRSEEVVGEALMGHRDKVFLMTKVCTHGRDKKVAMQQL
jgi:hypothetical protein